MRDAFFNQLYEIAKEDPRVILLSNDFGAPSLDKFRSDLSSQFISTGVAEQNMVNVARGLAMAGKVIYMYSIIPFMPLRCFEQIRHLCFDNLQVTGVGVGAGYSYELAGPTHHGLEDIAVMNALPGVTILNASDSTMAQAFARITYNEPGPKYVRLDRISTQIYEDGHDFSRGFIELRSGEHITIVATGYMVHQALKMADELAEHGIDAGVIDLFRIKPVNKDMVSKLTMRKPRRIVTLEENFISGGIGSIVSEILTDEQHNLKLKRIGVPNQYYFDYSGRAKLHQLSRLDVNRILSWYRRGTGEEIDGTC